MKPIYVIKIYDRVCPWQTENSDIGYFTGTYTIGNSDRGTYIGYGKIEPDGGIYNVKLFKTLKAAENKVNFLNEVKQRNADLSNMEFEIEELDPELAQRILNYYDDAKRRGSKKQVIYTAVSKSYLQQKLDIENEVDLNKLTAEKQLIHLGRIQILEEILDTLD